MKKNILFLLAVAGFVTATANVKATELSPAETNTLIGKIQKLEENFNKDEFEKAHENVKGALDKKTNAVEAQKKAAEDQKKAVADAKAAKTDVTKATQAYQDAMTAYKRSPGYQNIVKRYNLLNAHKDSQRPRIQKQLAKITALYQEYIQMKKPEVTTAAAEETTAAAEITTAAAEETTAAAEETTAAAEETTTAAEETTAAAEETTAAAEETTAAAEETTAPAEETTAAAEETTAPAEAVKEEPLPAKVKGPLKKALEALRKGRIAEAIKILNKTLNKKVAKKG